MKIDEKKILAHREDDKRYREKKLNEHPFKTCTCCGKEKPLIEFDKKGTRRFSQCKKCRSEQYYREAEANRTRANEHYLNNKEHILENRKLKREQNLAQYIIRTVKARAKKRGLEFNIDETDITIPEMCPVLGIPLKIGTGRAEKNSPSIDRIDSTKGYIKGNVIIVSNLANTIKTNATPQEIRKVADFYEKLQNK